MIKAVKQEPLKVEWRRGKRWHSWIADVEGERLYIAPVGRGSKLYNGYINYNFTQVFTSVEIAKTHLERIIKYKLRNY